MANQLENFVSNNRIDPVETMNRLQGAGVVSDLCVTLADVAPADCAAAVAWLLKNQLAKSPG